VRQGHPVRVQPLVHAHVVEGRHRRQRAGREHAAAAAAARGGLPHDQVGEPAPAVRPGRVGHAQRKAGHGVGLIQC
jgi:hypothetical protein